MNKTEFTHFFTDPDCAARAVIFSAYSCHACGGVHRRKDTTESVTPWGVAIFNNLIQLRITEIPEVGCPKCQK